MKAVITGLLKRTLLTSTGKSSAITFVSVVASTGFAALYFVLIARVLGPYLNGVFSVALATMLMITGIVDFGTNYGIIRFVPRSVSDGDPHGVRGYLKLALVVKIILGIAGSAVLALGARPIASFFLRRPEASSLLLVSSLGILGGLLYGYGLSLSQALQRFGVWGLLQAGSGVLRLVVILVLVAGGWLSPVTAVVAYLVMLLFPFVGSLPFWPNGLLAEPIKKEYVGNFFSFNRWMALYTVTTSITGSMPQFFLARFSGLSEVGYFVTAAQIAGVGLNVSVALSTVLVPKFAAFRSLVSLGQFLRKTILLTSCLALGGIFVSLFSAPLMLVIFGGQYLAGIVPLRILIVSVACILASLPFTSVWLYYRGDSRSYAVYFVLNVLVLFVSNLLLVPSHGAVGAATASLIGNVVTLLVAVGYTWMVFRRKTVVSGQMKAVFDPRVNGLRV